jgi:hypothetical protein
VLELSAGQLRAVEREMDPHLSGRISCWLRWSEFVRLQQFYQRTVVNAKMPALVPFKKYLNMMCGVLDWNSMDYIYDMYAKMTKLLSGERNDDVHLTTLSQRQVAAVLIVERLMVCARMRVCVCALSAM